MNYATKPRSDGSLRKLLGSFLQFFYEFKGIPIGGSEQVAFCGNYSGTAFGIHEGYENAFLCHFGPGTKHFYCWSKEEYLSVTNSRAPTYSTSELYDKLLDTGELFLLEPGDVLFLPAGVYHIGRQTEYSISVALPLYTYPLPRFTAGLVLPPLMKASFPFDQEGMSELIKEADYESVTNKLSELVDKAYSNWSAGELSQIFTFYWYSLISNGCWELSSEDFFDSSPENGLLPQLSIAMGDKVKIEGSYKVMVARNLRCSDSEARIFLAGKSVIVPDIGRTLNNLIATLNSGSELLVSSQTVQAFAMDLSRCGAVSVQG